MQIIVGDIGWWVWWCRLLVDASSRVGKMDVFDPTSHVMILKAAEICSRWFSIRAVV